MHGEEHEMNRMRNKLREESTGDVGLGDDGQVQGWERRRKCKTNLDHVFFSLVMLFCLCLCTI